MNARALFVGVIVGMLVFTTLGFAIQVDGYCYLQFVLNHSGTKVLFEADSPTAQTDSAFTDSSGHYQVDLLPGVYDINYTHQGYGNEALFDRLISASTTLPVVNLWDVPDGIVISGTISGVLEDTVYLVEGDLYVEHNDTLSIEAGAEFYFFNDGGNTYEFEIDGRIEANGTEMDTIKFAPAPGSIGWDGVIVDGTCWVHYCSFTGSLESTLWLRNCSGSGITVSHCIFVENEVGEYGVIRTNNTPSLITNCVISRNDGCGIRFDHSSPTIDSCVITGNTEHGIYSNNGSTPEINYCLIAWNEQHGVKINNSTYPQAVVNHCTIVGNGSNGVYIHYYPTHVINCILAGNFGGGILFDHLGENTISYSDFYDNLGGDFIGYVPAFLGTLITINPNGDSCDAYYNIFVDPLFVDPGQENYYLQETSLCIDAGDPATPPDPNGTPPDIGAFYYDALGVGDEVMPTLPTAYRLFPNYPNPFNPSAIISFALPCASPVQLVVYDIMGHRVTTLLNEWRDTGMHRVTFDGSQLASGIYFYRLQTGDFTETRKMVLLK